MYDYRIMHKRLGRIITWPYNCIVMILPVSGTVRLEHISLIQLQDQRKNEDPRLSFSTPEFKEAQRVFTENFKVRRPNIEHVHMQYIQV